MMNHLFYLHSTMVLFKSDTDRYSVDVQKFTFHYGPIQMELLKHQENVIRLFTFHYGPIQINF